MGCRYRMLLLLIAALVLASIIGIWRALATGDWRYLLGAIPAAVMVRALLK